MVLEPTRGRGGLGLASPFTVDVRTPVHTQTFESNVQCHLRTGARDMFRCNLG
jgi:hypothetical protein